MTLVSMTMLAIAGYVWFTAQQRADRIAKPSRQTLAQEVIVKARAAIAANEPQLARDLMQTYVRATPSDTEVRPLLARTLWNLGQNDQAQQVLEALQKLKPGLAETYWLAGEIAKADGHPDYLKYFAQAVNSPTVEPRMLSEYSLELLAVGKDSEAEKYLQRADEAVGNGPKDWTIWQGLGLVAMKKKQYDKAIANFKEAIRCDRTRPDPWRALAQAQRESGQVEQAALTLQEGLQATRDRTAIYYGLGLLRQSQSQPAEAADAFAAAADPDILDKTQRVHAATEAAIGYFQLGRYALAMKYVDLALTLDPQNARAREWVGKIEDARFGRATSQPAK